MSSYAERRGRVRELVAEQADALYVTESHNIRYLTGFTGSNGQLLLAAEPVFFTDGRYTEQAAAEVPDLDRVIYSGSTKFSDLFAKAIADRGVTKLGVESSHLTIASMDRLRAALEAIEVVPCLELVEKVRQRKDTAEIDAIRNAQQVAEAALVSTLRSWKGGTERDLALAIEWAMRTGGAEAVSFDVIVAGGSHSALPHATPRDVDIDLNGVLLIDIGARVDGYCSDMTRTFVGSGAPEPLSDVHAAVCAALEAACNAVRPGVKADEVDAVARTVLDEAGYGNLFVHSTGHGVGLDIHEGPSLGTTSEDVLETGMIVTIEPGAYLPGIGGARVEDLLVVTDDGAMNLTAIDRGPRLPG